MSAKTKENTDQWPESDSADAPEVAVVDDVASEEPQPPEDLAARIADLEGQLAQALDEQKESEEKFVRTAAELQNRQKQSSFEVDKARKFAIDGFAKEILDVLQSLESAGSMNEGVEDVDVALSQLTEGVEQIRNSLVGVLQKFSISEIPVDTGTKFNPELHEAVTMLPSDEVDPNHVVSVIRKGYTIHDRVLRAASVIVAASKPVEAESSSDEENSKKSNETP